MTRAFRTFSLTAALASSLLSASALAAGPSVDGDTRTVRVHLPGVEAAGPVDLRGDLLTIPLKGAVAPMKLDSEDPTIRRVEISHGALRVTLRHSRETSAKLVSHASLTNDRGELAIEMPRYAARSAHQALPTLKSAQQPAQAAAQPPAVAAQPTPAQPAAPQPVTAPAALPEAAAAAPARPTPVIPPPISEKEKAEAQGAAITADELSSLLHRDPAPASTLGGMANQSMLGLLGLCAIGGAGVFLFGRNRKRTTGVLADRRVQVLASQPIGNKARIVLLAVGNRELLVSVGDNGTELLSEWVAEAAPERDGKDDDAPEPKGKSQGRSSTPSVGRAEPSMPSWATQAANRKSRTAMTNSPAVDGILKLRSQRAAERESAGRDAAWADELLGAVQRTASAGVARGGRR